MSTVKHISFEALAGNLTEFLDKVRTEHTTLVVEYASGEQLLIKPHSPPRQNAREDQSDHMLLPPSDQIPDPREVGSAGAVYELDPNGLTPG